MIDELTLYKVLFYILAISMIIEGIVKGIRK